MSFKVDVGKIYEIVVTTWDGLYRYRTEDLVEVIGFYGTIPKYQFVRRSVLLDFSLTVKAAPHECIIRTSQP